MLGTKHRALVLIHWLRIRPLPEFKAKFELNTGKVDELWPGPYPVSQEMAQKQVLKGLKEEKL